MASFDDTTQSYSIGGAATSVLFYFLSNNSFNIYTPNSVRSIVASTTNNGLAYILYYSTPTGNTPRLDIINISDFSLINQTRYDSDDITFLHFVSGHPLLYMNDILYYEARNQFSNYNHIIQILQVDMSELISVNWILGWFSLFYSPACSNSIFGVQMGTLYSIDPSTGLFSPIIMTNCTSPIDQQLTQYVIDFSQSEIVVLSNCGSRPLVTLYDFNGNWICSFPFTNSQDCYEMQSFYGVQIQYNNTNFTRSDICPY